MVRGDRDTPASYAGRWRRGGTRGYTSFAGPELAEPARHALAAGPFRPASMPDWVGMEQSRLTAATVARPVTARARCMGMSGGRVLCRAYQPVWPRMSASFVYRSRANSRELLLCVAYQLLHVQLIPHMTTGRHRSVKQAPWWCACHLNCVSGTSASPTPRRERSRNAPVIGINSWSVRAAGLALGDAGHRSERSGSVVD
jgi:hypothetical protein